MELYIVRHAIAVDRYDSSVTSDQERWLTKEGIEKMEKAAYGFQKIVSKLDCIFTSPYRRAKETADILAKAYSKPVPVRELDELKPGALFVDIIPHLKKQPTDSKIAIVAHEPDLSSMISVLLAGNQRIQVAMKKGAICRIDFMENDWMGAGELVWFLPPKILREIC